VFEVQTYAILVHCGQKLGRGNKTIDLRSFYAKIISSLGPSCVTVELGRGEGFEK